MLDDLPVIHRILDQTFGDGSKVDDKTAPQEPSGWWRRVCPRGWNLV